MTESPAVFRNARYEARLALYEQRIAALEGLTAELASGLYNTFKALQALEQMLGAREDMLPGEWKPEPARRPN